MQSSLAEKMPMLVDIMRPLLVPVFVILLPSVYAQSLGTAPPAGLYEVDLNTAFRLPPLRDTSDGGLISALSSTQVGQRAAALSLNGTSPFDAWSKASNILSLPAIAPCSPRTVTFGGTSASQLNVLLGSGCVSITVSSPTLTIDQPIEINASGNTLDLGRCVLSSAGPLPYMLRVENASNISVRGGEFTGGMAGILINSSSNVRVENVVMHGLASDGIVVTNSTSVMVAHNRMRQLSGAGILLHNGASLSVVQFNEVARNQGFSNLAAGVVITDRDVDLISNPQAIFGPDGYWPVPEPITARIHPPHDNVIVFNRIFQNLSSGIYSDGGVRNTYASNTVTGNSKEGLCLDYGSTANVVTGNVFAQNGDRWGDPDWVLAADSISGGGRLADGTAAEKVPGVSLDNAMYNVVFANNLAHNFGGGIKLVRTGYFNLIGMNSLFSNNDGASDSFHFFGIELGAAAGDTTSAALDYTPSRGNIVFSNPIRGNHYSGIFFDAGSDLNNVFDNTIMDAQAWALESAAVMANDSLNNLTNISSRNIGSGLDPALLTIGQPVLDPPHLD
jgi:parallel beta-helix repeat protein